MSIWGSYGRDCVAESLRQLISSFTGGHQSATGETEQMGRLSGTKKRQIFWQQLSGKQMGVNEQKCQWVEMFALYVKTTLENGAKWQNHWEKKIHKLESAADLDGEWRQ